MYYINIFTYKGDEDIVLYTAKSCLKTFGSDCEVHIIDDFNNPIDNLYKKELLEIGVLYRQSKFNRYGNLTTVEATRGVIDEYYKTLNGRNGIIMKLDCDTLIFSRKIFDEFEKDDSQFYCTNLNGYLYSGMCYCIKSETLNKLKTYSNMFLTCLNNNDFCPEDYFIGNLISLIALPNKTKIISIYNNNRSSFDAIFWNFNIDLEDKEIIYYYKTNFSLVSLTNIKYDRLNPNIRKNIMKTLLK